MLLIGILQGGPWYSGYGDVTRSNEPRSVSGIKIIY